MNGTVTTETWEIGRAGELADAYNEQIVCVPYSFPVTESTMAAGAQREQCGLNTEQLVVGLRGASIVSFTQVGKLDSSESDSGDLSPSG